MIDDIRAKLKMAKDANENFRPIPDEALIYDVEIRALLDQHDADQRALAARDDRIAALETALNEMLVQWGDVDNALTLQVVEEGITLLSIPVSNRRHEMLEVVDRVRAALKGSNDEETQ